MLATQAAFGQSRGWLDTVRTHFTAQIDLLTVLVAEHLPGVTFHPPRASFLTWLYFGNTDLTEEPSQYFLRETRVALSPGTNFGAVGQGYFRLNMGTSAERLERIVNAMRTA